MATSSGAQPPEGSRQSGGADDAERDEGDGTASRDERARAALTPLQPGERPLVIWASAAVAAAIGLANLISWLAGVKIGGKHPAGAGIIVFSGLMIACAIGVWRLWYGAVLGFMALMAIIATVFSLLAIEASNLLGLVVSVAVVACSGYLFYKLVRVLGRIQTPHRADGSS